MATQAANPTTSTVTLLGEWLAMLDRQGVTARNREAHRMGVERMGEYLRPRSIDDATATDIRGFLAYLGELGVSEQSRGVYRQILEKWVTYAQAERRRAEIAAAAAAAMTGGGPLDVEAGPGEDAADATMVLDISSMGAPVVATEDDVTEVQAESTWPFAKPRPAPAAAGPLAAAFDAPAPDGPPAAPVTIDFVAEASAVEPELLVEAAPTMALPAFGALTFDPPASPAPPPAMEGWGGTATASPFGSASPDPVAFPEPAAPAFGGFDAPSAFGGAAFGSAHEAGSAFSSAPVGGADDATPPRGMKAMTLPGPAPRAEAPVRDAAGDHVMGESVASIPLGGTVAAEKKRKEEAAAAPAPTTADLKAKVQGWGLRMNGTERTDLDLTQIRNMVATGAITPHSLIRKPGGEWMKAGDYHPLRSVFQQARRAPVAGMEADAPPPGPSPLAHPVARAWMGAVAGMLAGAAAWWLVSVVAGREIPSMGLLVGFIVGALSAWVGRGEDLVSLAVGALALVGAMLVGRGAVYQTMKSGLLGGRDGDAVDPFVFLAASASIESLQWWGLGLLVAAATCLAGVLWRRR